MATQKEIEYIMGRIGRARPSKVNRKINVQREGLKHVLLYLSKTGRPVSAGEISSVSGISTARAAVIIRKLQEKELIIKSTDPKDGRKAMITLSEKGMKYAEAHNRQMKQVLARVIDEVGMEKLELFLDLSFEIYNAVEAEMKKCSLDKML